LIIDYYLSTVTKLLPLLLTCVLTAVLPALLAAGPLPVVVALPPHAWLVEAVGGGRVEAQTLVGPGDSPATFQPSDRQVSRLLEARLLFRAGAPFEHGPWFRAVRGAALEVVDLRHGVEALETDHSHGRTTAIESGHDPHIWLSPRRLVVQARTVATALARHDPAGRTEYERNYDRLATRLTELDAELAAALAPHTGRAFVVFHPSWSYFAADYGLRQIAVETAGKEPSDRELTRLAAAARAARIRVVFVQPQIGGRAAAALATALGADLAVLDPLARDVPANLRAVARTLIASFEP
jgi:zinc transport system substrate-binding protein